MHQIVKMYFSFLSLALKVSPDQLSIEFGNKYYSFQILTSSTGNLNWFRSVISHNRIGILPNTIYTCHISFCSKALFPLSCASVQLHSSPNRCALWFSAVVHSQTRQQHGICHLHVFKVKNFSKHEKYIKD